MSSVSKEIVDAILDKDNINANEKIYNALYGKSSEQLQARKIEIAKHFFDPEDASKESGNENELDMEFAVQERRPMDPFIPEMAAYDGQRQLVMGQPLDVADNFPYRHRAQTFA